MADALYVLTSYKLKQRVISLLGWHKFNNKMIIPLYIDMVKQINTKYRKKSRLITVGSGNCITFSSDTMQVMFSMELYQNRQLQIQENRAFSEVLSG